MTTQEFIGLMIVNGMILIGLGAAHVLMHRSKEHAVKNFYWTVTAFSAVIMNAAMLFVVI